MGKNICANSKKWRAKQGGEFKKREVTRVSAYYVPQGTKTIEERDMARARARKSMAKTRARRKAEKIAQKERPTETETETESEVGSVFVNVYDGVFRKLVTTIVKNH